MQVLQCALVTYDLMESLVVRIEEIIEDSQKWNGDNCCVLNWIMYLLIYLFTFSVAWHICNDKEQCESYNSNIFNAILYSDFPSTNKRWTFFLWLCLYFVLNSLRTILKEFFFLRLNNKWQESFDTTYYETILTSAVQNKYSK